MEVETAKVKQETSPKLHALLDELSVIIAQADSEALDEEDARQKRKVIIFSHYEETIDWIESYLLKIQKSDERLDCYKGRTASVSGRESRNGIQRIKAIHGFAPVSTQAIPPNDLDNYDLLIATDVLAEGMNLQQCRNIINYDLPWNPMRLVQRHGRIDRIGSKHNHVYMRTFFPDEQLDALLKLEERVQRKLAQAAASVGVEDTPIQDGSEREQSFTETRDEIEKLHKKDATIYEQGGTESAAQTGEEYRQELREALKRYGDKIENLPWRVGSGMVKGDKTGHFFCASVGERIYLRFVPIIMDEDNEIISELGTCLRLIECTYETVANLSTDMIEKAYEAWDIAHNSIYEAWMYETDPANLQPKIRTLNLKVAEFIQENPPDEINQERLDYCTEAVQSPWSRRDENLLRIVWNNEYSSDKEKSLALIKKIENIGIEPYQAPDPLPLIEKDETHLICWLAIQSEA